MKLLNNYLLIKPRQATEITTKSGIKLFVSTTKGGENPELKEPRFGEVMEVPDKINNELAWNNIPQSKPEYEPTRAQSAYEGITFTECQLQKGDTVYFHYNTGILARSKNKSLVELGTGDEYWFVPYIPFRSIYAFERNGILQAFEYNILFEAVIQTHLSEHIIAPDTLKEKSSEGRVYHGGKTSLKKGDEFYYTSFSNIPIGILDKTLYVCDGLVDVLATKEFIASGIRSYKESLAPDRHR